VGIRWLFIVSSMHGNQDSDSCRVLGASGSWLSVNKFWFASSCARSNRMRRPRHPPGLRSPRPVRNPSTPGTRQPHPAFLLLPLHLGREVTPSHCRSTEIGRALNHG
jgi:hypothetical protein